MDLTDVVGGYGPWQRMVLIVIIYRAIPLAFVGTSAMFFVATTDHWCARPDNLGWTVDEWRQNAIPKVGEVYSHCEHYRVFYNGSGEVVVDTNDTVKCDAWEYDGEYGNTLIKEFNLVCDQSWKRALIHTTVKIGNTVAFLPGGYLADRFGRKKVTMWGIVACLVISTVAAFSPSYNFYLVLRTLIGFTYGIIVTGSLCLLLEVLGPDHRHKVSYSFMGGWGVGMMLVPGIYWLDQDWKHAQLIFMVPFLLAFLATIWWFVPESTRWLLTSNQDEKAEAIITKAAKMNSVQLVDKDAVMDSLKKKIIQDVEIEVKRASYFDLYRTKVLRKCSIVLNFTYFFTAFSFFGFTLTVQALGASLYLTIFLMGLVEIIAVGFYVPISLYARRRLALVSLCMATAIFYLIAIPVPNDMLWLRLTLAMGGHLTNSAVYQLMWIVSAEIYPTTHRSVGVNGCMTFGRIGSVLSTFLVAVAQASNSSTLLVIFGVMIGLSGLLYLLLPETKDKHLPDTIAASKKLAQEEKECARQKKAHRVV